MLFTATGEKRGEKKMVMFYATRWRIVIGRIILRCCSFDLNGSITLKKQSLTAGIATYY